MAWPKGVPRKGIGCAGSGRPKGAKNKISRPFAIRMQECLDNREDKELDRWFKKNMTEAMRVMASLERKKVEVSGPDGGPINAKVEIVFANDKHKS